MPRVPLFPLNTVLFPGTPLALRVFEPRYRRMISECIESSSPFGVVLIRDGDEAYGPPAEPHDVGCLASIQRIETVDGGRMNVVAKGCDRFRIVGTSKDRSLLIGDVELLTLTEPNRAERLRLAEDARDLHLLIRRYLDVLAAVGGGRVRCVTLPTEPAGLAWLGAFLLQIAQARKQSILASKDTLGLLASVRDLYARELPLLRMIAADGAAPVAEPFSGN